MDRDIIYHQCSNLKIKNHGDYHDNYCIINKKNIEDCSRCKFFYKDCTISQDEMIKYLSSIGF
jgi:hypothetical protein